jgi:aminoglycoside phosphotransferase (APT) family kinase protein
VVALVDETSGLVHGDLNPANVLVAGEGYRLIDWQRPLFAPRELDQAALFEGRPSLFEKVHPLGVAAFCIVRLHWTVMSRAHYLPELPHHTYSWWAAQALDKIDAIRRTAR